MAILAVVALVTSSCSSGGSDAPTGEGAEAEQDAGKNGSTSGVHRTRYQDAWVFSRIATVDLEGEVVDLTDDVLALADGLDEAVPLVGRSEFLIWPELDAHLVDFDGSVREDVEVTGGILRNDEGEALMLVATPEGEDTLPIDHDDQFSFDLTDLGDLLQPGDPLVYEYAFAHTYGPDEADAPESGPALFSHRAAAERIGYAVDESAPEPAIVTDLGQAYEGSTRAGGPAKHSAMQRAFAGGTQALETTTEGPGAGLPAVMELLSAVHDGAVRTWRQIGEQLCVGSPDDCIVRGGIGGGGGGRGDGSGGGGDGDDGGGGGAGGGGDGAGNHSPDVCRYRAGHEFSNGRCTPGPEGEPDPPPTVPGPTTPGGGGGTGSGGGGTGTGGGEGDSGGRSGKVHGDPYLVTLDGASYVMHAVGEFVLAETEGWTTQVRFVPGEDDQPFSVTGVVAVQFGDDVVVLDAALPYAEGSADEPTTTLNGEPIELVSNGPLVREGLLTFGYEQGYLRVGHRDLGLVGIKVHAYPVVEFIAFDDDDRFEGLMGNGDGDPRDDLRLGRGSDEVVTNDAETILGPFADAWRVTDGDSLLPYGPGETTETYTDREFPRESTEDAVAASPRRAQAEVLCALAGVPEDAMDGCITDYTLTGDVRWITDSSSSPLLDALAAAVAAGAATGGGEAATWSATVSDLKSNNERRRGTTDGEAFFLIATDPETDEHVVLAVDAESGDELWRVSGITIGCDVAILGDGRIVVIGDEEGSLAGDDDAPTFNLIDPTSGEVMASVPYPDAPSTYCLPTQVDGDRVLVTNGLGAITAWDIGAEPSIAWTAETVRSIEGAIVVGEGQLVVHRRTNGETAGDVLELRGTTDGELIAVEELPGRDQSDGESMVTAEGLVAVALQRSDDADLLGIIATYRVDGGALEPAWELPVYGEDAGQSEDRTASLGFSGLSTDGSVLVAHSRPDLWAIDLETGDVRWRTPPSDFRNTDLGAVIIGDRVYDTSFGGPAVVVFSPDDRSGPVAELSADDLFGAGTENAAREVIGPVADGLMLVEGTGPEGELVLAVIDVG